MDRSMIKAVYAILGAGLALAFLGHGILGLKGYETFTELVAGNYDKLLGGTMSTDAATTIVNVIGAMDVVLAVAFVVLVVAAWRGSEIAYSPLALGLFGWALAWGFRHCVVQVHSSAERRRDLGRRRAGTELHAPRCTRLPGLQGPSGALARRTATCRPSGQPTGHAH